MPGMMMSLLPLILACWTYDRVVNGRVHGVMT